MTEMTPEKLDALADELAFLGKGKLGKKVLYAASAWEADRVRIEALEKLKGLTIPKGEWSICADHNRAYWTDEGCFPCRIEALEIKAARWLALASPMWVGDESEGHFVCLACNQRGTDDGGTKTIRHIPDCEYAAALATTIVTSSDQNGSALAEEEKP